MKHPETRPEDRSFNQNLVLLVLACFLVLAGAVVLRVGLDATSYGATDSKGRTMGFNDPLSLEHYLIMVGNFDPLDLLNSKYGYAWLLFVMQVVGAWLLLANHHIKVSFIRWFFILQVLFFPLGIPALLLSSAMAVGFLIDGMDREGFVDVPFILIVAQPPWVVISSIIAIVLRGPGFRLTHLWRKPDPGEP